MTVAKALKVKVLNVSIFIILFSLLATISYLVYGVKLFGYDTPKYIYQLKILEKYGPMIIIPSNIRQLLAIKYNYIYLCTFLAYIIVKLFHINTIYAFPTLSTLVLLPFYGLSIFALTLLAINEFIGTNRRRIVLITLAAAISIPSLFTSNIVYLATHLYRQFLNVILFNILLIVLSLATKGKNLRYISIIITLLIILMALNQIESAIFSILFIIFIIFATIIFKSNDLAYFRRQLIIAVTTIFLIVGTLVILSYMLNISQISGIISSAIKGFKYFSSRQEPLIYKLSDNKGLAIEVLGGYYGARINLLILGLLPILYLVSKKRYPGIFDRGVTYIISVYAVFVLLIALSTSLPWIFQIRSLLFTPIPVCYLIFSFYIAINLFVRNAKAKGYSKISFIAIILILFLSLSLFNISYSFKELIPRWTRPYIDEKFVNYMNIFNEKICSNDNNHTVIFIIYMPKYKYWEFSIAWLYRNWIHALSECRAFVFYGTLGDLINGVNTLKHRRFSNDVLRNYFDVISNFNNTNNMVLSLMNSHDNLIVVIIKKLYQYDDIQKDSIITSKYCRCLERAQLKFCGIIVCNVSRVT